jgi:hypothetical protein
MIDQALAIDRPFYSSAGILFECPEVRQSICR